MAVDKLVDSSKLDACCTAEANAIRAKTGDSASLTYDWSNSKGFADEIGAINSAPSWLSIVTNFRFGSPYDPPTLPENLEIYTENLSLLTQMFQNTTTTNCKTIKIKSDVSIKEMGYAFNRRFPTDCIITIDADLSQCKSYQNCFDAQISGNPHASTIIANIDFSGITSQNNVNGMFNNNASIANITFVPNTLQYNLSLNKASNLTTASLVSLGNCLKAVSGKTLTLHATPKDNLSNIMGTVTNNGTYDLFTLDAGGSVTLLSFITTTKGWTVA